MGRRNFLKLFIASFLAWLIRLFDRTKAQEPEGEYKVYLPIVMTNSENWEIVKPKETTNLITNPSFEEGTTGYSACDAGIVRSSASQMFGVYSLNVAPANDFSEHFVSYDVGISNDSASYIFSLWAKFEDGHDYRLDFIPDSGPEISSTNFVGTGYWQSASLQSGVGSGATTVDIRLVSACTDEREYYTDAWQFEQATACARTTYCDGDQPGCYWLGEPHASRSRRDGQSREGGEIINLSTDYQVIVRQQQGAGMPDIDLIETDTGLQDGGLFQRSLAGQRQLQIDGVISGSDVTDFHYNRKRLIDAVKTDLVSPEQPFLLRYTGIDGVIMQGRFFYDAGLELGQVRNLTEMFSMRAIAFDPYWEEFGDQGVELTPARELSGDFSVLHREISGCWVKGGCPVNGGTTDGAYALHWKNAGLLYIGGDFNAYDSLTSNTASNVASWDRTEATEEFAELDNGLRTDWHNAEQVNAIARAPNGNIYFGGVFNLAGAAGTSVCHIVEWDGTQWQQVKEEGSNKFGVAACSDTLLPISDMAFDDNGLLWVVGTFDTAGCTAASGIAAWNTSTCTWFVPSDTGVRKNPDSGVNKVRAGMVQNDKVWFAGNFDELGGSTVCYVGYYNTSTSLFSASQDVGLGSLITACGLDNGLGIEKAPDGTIFAILNSGGGDDFLVQFNGGDFTFVACPLGGTGFLRQGARSGNVYLAPTQSYGIEGEKVVSDVAFYNGTTFLPLDFALPAFVGPLYRSLDENPEGGVTVGLSQDTSSASVGGFDVVSNDGTATTFPIITLSGSGNLYTISNYTRGDILYFDEYALHQGDKIIINLEEKTAISKQKGNITRHIHPGANFADWRLSPGNNNISVFITNTTASATMRWKKRHWSLDGGAT